MGSAGAGALAGAWKAGATPNLQQLDLPKNGPCPTGAQALAKAWPPGLSHLNLSHRWLEANGARTLAATWQAGACANLVHLDF